MEVRTVIIQWYRVLVNYGVEQGIDVIHKNRIKFVNHLILFGLPFTLLFCILNLIHAKYFLCSLNFSALVCSVTTYFIHPYKKYDRTKLALNLLLGTICSVQAVCFHNGLEFYHVQNLVLILIFFDDRYFIIPACLYSVVLFVITKYIITTHPAFIFPIDQSRMLSNVFLSLITTLLGALYFKQNLYLSLQVLKKKNNALANSNKTKEKLFSIIAHDFRAPISQIMSTLDLVTNDYMSQNEFNGLNEQFQQRLKSLLADMDNLLMWSQGQLSGITAHKTNFLLGKVVEEVVTLLAPLASKKDILLSATVNDSFVFADINHVRIVVRNLVANAIKFSRRGTAIYITSTTENNTVSLSVKDEGVGMTTEQVAAFSQNEYLVSTAGTEKEKGTGLGLIICKEFLNINNGSITVSSQLNQGTHFTIQLPRGTNS